MATNHEVGSSILSGRTILPAEPGPADSFLSFVQLVSTGSFHAAQIEILLEQRHSLSLRTLVCRFILPQDRLNLLGEETTDGGGTAGSENSQLLDRLPGQGYCHVLPGCIHCDADHTVERMTRTSPIALTSFFTPSLLHFLRAKVNRQRR